MSGEAIFLPVLVQVALTFVIYGVVSFRRVGAVTSGKASHADYRVPIVEPQASATAIRSLSNQFELPILFYVCCVILFELGAVSTVALGLAWLFVATRIAHAAIHVTTNRLKRRRPLFIAGLLAVLFMWALVFWRLMSAA